MKHLVLIGNLLIAQPASSYAPVPERPVLPQQDYEIARVYEYGNGQIFLCRPVSPELMHCVAISRGETVHLCMDPGPRRKLHCPIRWAEK